MKIRTKAGYKLVNIDGDYNFMLAKIKISLVVLVKELKLFCL